MYGRADSASRTVQWYRLAEGNRKRKSNPVERRSWPFVGQLGLSSVWVGTTQSFTSASTSCPRCNLIV
jgi:hypothetical protein